MTKKILKATHEADLEIGGKKLPCAVLEDGTRIISRNAIFRAFERTKRGRSKGEVRVLNMPSFIDANNLQPFINNELADELKGIEFLSKNDKLMKGFKAEILPEICNVYLEARRKGNLTKSQLPLAIAAEILTQGLSKVGIIALIDEATGYQEVRDKLALSAILDKYIRDDYRKWTQQFPQEFYKEMFRLRNWTYDEKSIKRPSVLGTYTNNIVYKRLAPGVLKELREKNPTDEKGHRKQRHHQWLTDNIGIPKLREHIYGAIALMKASPNWGTFLRLLNRAYQRYGDTIEMDLEDEI